MNYRAIIVELERADHRLSRSTVGAHLKALVEEEKSKGPLLYGDAFAGVGCLKGKPYFLSSPWTTWTGGGFSLCT